MTRPVSVAAASGSGRFYMKQLIINADDFGADSCRNRGIAAAVAAGAVTAVSVLVNGPAFAEGLPLLDGWQRRGIAVGLHLNLSEGRPLAKGLTVLAGDDGGFQGKTATHALLMQKNSGKLAEDILTETEAQIVRLGETGIRIDHLDGHQHVHVFPGAAAVVVAAAARHGIPRVRLPSETRPEDNARRTCGQKGAYDACDRDIDSQAVMALRPGNCPWETAGEPGKQKQTRLNGSFKAAIPEDAAAMPTASLLREAALFSGLATAARPLLAAAGIRTTDHFRGLCLKNRLSLPLLEAVFRELPAGLTELMVHPGDLSDTTAAVTGPFAAFATGDRQRELAVLLTPEFLDLLKKYEIKLISHPEAGS